MLNSIGQDLRFAWRVMRKAPGVTAIALAALALGIGSTSAIFSLIYGVMLRPLPYDQPERIVKLNAAFPERHNDEVDAPWYVFWKEHQQSLSSIAAVMGGTHLNLEGGDRPERILVRPEHFLLWLIGSFAMAAVLLAVLGIYGVMSYLVTERTHELGIRAALGARRSDLLRMVLGQAAQRAVMGLSLALVGAYALTRLLNSYLCDFSAR